MATNATIVIPVYNGWEFTRACLDSVLATLRKGDNVVVVDDGSTDGVTFEGLEALAMLDSRVVYVRRGANWGFANACNAGARYAHAGDVLIFLNNDTIVFPGWLDLLLTPLANESVGAVGPVSNFVSGPQLMTSRFATPGEMWRVARAGALSEMAAYVARTWGRVYELTPRLVGFCLATSVSTFRLIGGFREDYGIGGYEDDDYCRRLSAREMDLLIARGCFVYHHGHATFDANGLDWKALQDEAQRVFLSRWE